MKQLYFFGGRTHHQQPINNFWSEIGRSLNIFPKKSWKLVSHYSNGDLHSFGEFFLKQDKDCIGCIE